MMLTGFLVGVPLFALVLTGDVSRLEEVLAFPPDCENWAQDPQHLWQVKCPFNWGVFLAMGAVVMVALAPFVRRLVRARALAAKIEPARRYRFPAFGWCGLVIMGGGWILSWTRFEWFAPCQRYFYLPLWAGFILVMNALCVRRTGTSPLTGRTRSYLLLFPVSSAFWWFFEYLNRYVWNWFYVGVPGISACEYAVFATLCFASVLPGVTAVAAWLNTFAAFRDVNYAGMAKVNVRSRTSMTVMTGLTLVGLVGIVFIPQLTYPLLWISPLMGFVLLQVWWREPSVLDRLAEGTWGTVFRFAVAAFICGLAWETWNYYALAKWIYSVPYAHRFLVWEMPIMGFAGYLPFGLECAALAAWVDETLV